QLTWYDREGRLLNRVGEPGDYQDPSLSPDSSRVAYSQTAAGRNRQVKVFNLARGTNTMLTSTVEGARSPDWSPDWKHIVYASIRGNGLNVTESNGSGHESALSRDGGNKISTGWSRDGRYIICTETSASGLDVFAFSDPLGASAKRIP